MPCSILTKESCFAAGGCSPSVDPTKGAVYAPFVKLEFADVNLITVGNKSTSGNLRDTCTITSFEFGLTPGEKGYGADIEILDAGGESYRKILKAVNKTIGKGKEEFSNVIMDWGWITVDTKGGAPQLITARTTTGNVFGGIFTDAETNFEGGNVKVKLKVRAPQANELSVSYTGTMGSEDNLMDLVTALQKLFTEYSQFEGVIYKTKDGNPTSGDGFFEGGGKGPRSAWPMQQSNAFTIARMWLSTVRTRLGKGIIILHDPTHKNQIIIHEDPSDENCCDNSVGTFIINAGNCSPVISFNPTINWPKGFIPGGGGVAGSSSTGQSNNILKSPDKVELAGTQSQYSVPQHDWNHRVPEQHASAATAGGEAHQNTANAVGAATGAGSIGFNAELKIIGDPHYCTVLGPVKKTENQEPEQRSQKGEGLFGKFLSIIFLNPWYIASPLNADKNMKIGATWIKESSCNTFLTSKKYMIQGVSHQISSGTYTTTFNLKMLQNNVEIPIDAKLGYCGTKDLSEGNMGKLEAPQTNTGEG